MGIHKDYLTWVVLEPSGMDCILDGVALVNTLLLGILSMPPKKKNRGNLPQNA